MSSKVSRKATKSKTTAPVARVGVPARSKRAARKLEPAVERQASLPLAPVAKATKRGGKAIAPRLLEALERRRRASEENDSGPVKPAGRRGRRPKAGYTEYQPDEEGVSAEPETESLEYDTGIKVARKEDEFGALDRSEDFEEELNFDW